MPSDRRTAEQLLLEVQRLERRLAEQTRIASYLSEERYQFLASLLPQQMWTATPDGALDYVNSRVVAYSGIPFERLLGAGWIAMVHPDDAPGCGARWQHSLTTGEPYDVEFRLRAADGTWRWHAGAAHPFRVDGEIQRWYGINTDISSAKLENEALARSRSRYRLLSEAVTDGLWIWDVRTGAVEWNDRLLALLGVSRAEWGGTFADSLDRIHPEDRPALEAALEAHLTRRVPYEVPVFRLRAGDGSYRFCSTRGQAEFDAEGRPTRMAGGVSDIDQQVRLQRGLAFLAEASRMLHASLEWEETLARVARVCVPELADWCAVDLLDADGSLRRLAVAHVDPLKERLAADLHERWPPDPNATSGVPEVLRTCRSERYEEITDAVLEQHIEDPVLLRIVRDLGLRSSMVVPLVVEGRAIGAISFVSAESERRFTETDLSLAEDLALRASTALHNARLFAEVASHRRDV